MAFKHHGKIPYPTSLQKDVCSITSSDCYLVSAHSQMLGWITRFFSVQTCFFKQGICIPRCNNFDVNGRPVLHFVSELHMLNKMRFHAFFGKKCGFTRFRPKVRFFRNFVIATVGFPRIDSALCVNLCGD